MEKYLTPNKIISVNEAKIIFKIRSQTINIKTNMKNKYKDTTCIVCGKYEETQRHILLCEMLKENNSKETLKYEHIYTNDLYNMKQIAKLFEERLNNRKSYLPEDIK